MKYLLSIFYILLLASTAYAGGCQTGWGHGSVCNVTSDGSTPSCEVADVQAAHDTATLVDGDTISVPAGSCTWDTPLTITKAIIIQGAGIGSTNITSNYTSVGYKGSFAYYPETPASDHRFRLTGFSYNNGGKSFFFHAYQTTSTPETIRVDNNDITLSGSYRAFYIEGSFYGVIDNNTVTGSGLATVAKAEGNDSVAVGDRVQWGILPRTFGDGNNLHFEDNTFSVENGMMISSGTGGRYLFRYNAFTSTVAVNMGEMHGNQPAGSIGAGTGGNSGTMIVEIYGNTFQKTSTYFNQMFDQRGGKLLFFYNKIINEVNNSNTTGWSREEYADEHWPAGNTEVMKATSTYIWGNWQHKTVDTTLLPWSISTTENCCLADPEAWQAAYDYGDDLTCKRFTGDSNDNCWKSYVSGTHPGTSGESEPNWEGTAERYTLDDGLADWLNMGTGSPIIANVDVFVQGASFDGTTGVGCGTLTALQEAAYYTSCTAGVGYWATTQSCTDLTNMVGKSPSSTISGTLYKCNATGNGWDVLFSPYTYPHPLRGTGKATATIGSGSVMSIGSGATATLY
jgi:hypothetical protein